MKNAAAGVAGILIFVIVIAGSAALVGAVYAVFRVLHWHPLSVLAGWTHL